MRSKRVSALGAVQNSVWHSTRPAPALGERVLDHAVDEVLLEPLAAQRPGREDRPHDHARGIDHVVAVGDGRAPSSTTRPGSVPRSMPPETPPRAPRRSPNRAPSATARLPRRAADAAREAGLTQGACAQPASVSPRPRDRPGAWPRPRPRAPGTRARRRSPALPGRPRRRARPRPPGPSPAGGRPGGARVRSSTAPRRAPPRPGPGSPRRSGRRRAPVAAPDHRPPPRGPRGCAGPCAAVAALRTRPALGCHPRRFYRGARSASSRPPCEETRANRIIHGRRGLWRAQCRVEVSLRRGRCRPGRSEAPPRGQTRRRGSPGSAPASSRRSRRRVARSATRSRSCASCATRSSASRRWTSACRCCRGRLPRWVAFQLTGVEEARPCFRETPGRALDPPRRHRPPLPRRARRTGERRGAPDHGGRGPGARRLPAAPHRRGASPGRAGHASAGADRGSAARLRRVAQPPRADLARGLGAPRSSSTATACASTPPGPCAATGRYRVLTLSAATGAACSCERPMGIVFHTSESDMLAARGATTRPCAGLETRTCCATSRRNQVYHYLDRPLRPRLPRRETRQGEPRGHVGLGADADKVYLNLNHAFFGVSFETRWEGGRALPITRAQLEAGRSLYRLPAPDAADRTRAVRRPTASRASTRRST